MSKRATKAPAVDHRGAHQAPDQKDAPLWDLTGGDIYPKDVYLYGERYYGVGDGSDRGAWGTVFAYQRRPLKPLKVYRAVPKSVVGAKIAAGDWVTISRSYATLHGRSSLAGEFKVISKTVKAGDLFTDGNSILEWGYWPMSPGALAQFRSELAARRVAARVKAFRSKAHARLATRKK